MRTCLSSQLCSMSGKQGTTSLGRTEELPSPQRGSPTFAQTPQSWTPANGASFYDGSHKAMTRGRAYYSYDAGGRTTGVNHWWDTWNSGTSSYSSAPIRANECSYELTGLNRGLKTQNKFYSVSGGAWNLQRSESYGYDGNLDYLTSANYGDGLANPTPAWTYDAAGNRASDSTNSGTWTYDNLNRMTASPGISSYENDILGNRTLKGGGSSATSYQWDDLNRMTSLQASGMTSGYAYRADGLRVSKASHAGSTVSNLTTYRYDGQMGIEDVESTSTNGGLSYAISAINRFALGGRGIDAISRTTSSGTGVTYPLYDAHGNGIGSLFKDGASWAVSDERSIDAWGGIRAGGTSDNKGKYCASLGHKQDEESGFVYMRARYYEPETGRFVSEDTRCQGFNWYVYSKNNPVKFTDESGNQWKIQEKKVTNVFMDFMILIESPGSYLAKIEELEGLIDIMKEFVSQCEQLEIDAIMQMARIEGTPTPPGEAVEAKTKAIEYWQGEMGGERLVALLGKVYMIEMKWVMYLKMSELN